MNEHFEPGEGERLGSIGHQPPRGVPAPGYKEPASAIEGRASEGFATDTKNLH
jgi:hypothetical protein